MKYALSVEVKLQAIEEPEETPALQPGSDPIQGMVGVLSTLGNRVVRPAMFMGSAPGFDFRKSMMIEAKNFRDLSNIIGRFDNLAIEIEASGRFFQTRRKNDENVS